MDNTFYSKKMLYNVVIADINYGNHVGNSAFLNIIHEARLDFLKNLGDFSEINIGDKLGLIMLSVHLDFKAQVFHHHLLEITTGVEFIKNSSFGLTFTILNQSHENNLCLKGSATFAAFNYTENKLARLPQNFIDVLKHKGTLYV